MRATVAGATGLAVASALALVGAATATAATTPPVLTVQAGQRLATVGHESIGVNTAVWNGHLVDPGVAGQIRRAGFGELEFNGGGVMDLYHWRDGSLSPDPEAALHTAENLDYASIPPQLRFDQFERSAHQVGANTLVHVNYGTGSPREAAAWVRYANLVRHDGVRDWAIGEEVWGNGGLSGIDFEPDAHADRSPAAYGRGALAYARAMKAVDPSIKIGVELAPPIPGSPLADWDKTVLAAAGRSVDFVDVHWYPFGPQPDFYTPVRDVPQIMAATRELVGPRTRIVVGETNSAIAVGQQQTSTANALYLADDELSMLEHGASSVDWWDLFNGSATNDADLGLISSGTTLSPGPGSQPTDVPFAPYYGQVLTSALARPGSRLVPVTGTAGPVYAHAARQRDGDLVVLLLNEDATASHPVDLRVDGYTPAGTARQSFLGGAGTGITTSRTAATGQRTLPANSITELVLRPGR